MKVDELLHDHNNFYIVTELCKGGDLTGRISGIKMTENKAALMIKQILRGINYMHAKNLIHRDMKPDNVLMASTDTNNLDLKLADFGFSTFYDPKVALKMSLGSPMYMAPEVLNKKEYNEKADLWSVGIITFEILAGALPWDVGSLEELKEAIEENYSTIKNHQRLKGISKEGKDFLTQSLQFDAKKRWSAT